MDQNSFTLEIIQIHTRLLNRHLEARDQAFLAARDSGATLREIAEAGGVSSTTVRRILDRLEQPTAAATVDSPDPHQKMESLGAVWDAPSSGIADGAIGAGRWDAPRRRPAVIRQAIRARVA